MRGLGPGNYLKEIRYNGRPLGGDTVPLDPSVITHSVTIVVSDDPGAILGTVMADEKRVGDAYVIAMKWPPAEDQFPSGWAIAKSDAMGNFQMSGLAPGEYRIGAARTLPAATSNAAIQRGLATDGKKVDVGANQVQNLTIEVTDWAGSQLR